MKVKVSCLARCIILQVAALATLSLISPSEQVTALSTVQAHYLNVLPAFWNSFSIISLLLIPELMILQQCFHQQQSAYPFFMTQSKNFLDLHTSNSSIWAPEPHLGVP